MAIRQKAYDYIKEQMGFGKDDAFVFKSEEDFYNRLNSVKSKWVRDGYDAMRSVLDSEDVIGMMEVCAAREGVAFTKRKFYVPHKVLGYDGSMSFGEYDMVGAVFITLPAVEV